MGFVIGTQLTRTAPLFFETGLSYTEKGGKSDYQGGKFAYSLNYLEMPLLLKYKYYAGPDVSIEPFLGGYLAVGVRGGKIKDYGERQAIRVSTATTPAASNASTAVCSRLRRELPDALPRHQLRYWTANVGPL